ncbi:hypothetical protein EDC01DRAFT_629253 [Geopyxis carbonaria]|nr:hypothetical protein EDC01DRAFT_629253 [Geopyxis carbonaria]
MGNSMRLKFCFLRRRTPSPETSLDFDCGKSRLIWLVPIRGVVVCASVRGEVPPVVQPQGGITSPGKTEPPLAAAHFRQSTPAWKLNLQSHTQTCHWATLQQLSPVEGYEVVISSPQVIAGFLNFNNALLIEYHEGTRARQFPRIAPEAEEQIVVGPTAKAAFKTVYSPLCTAGNSITVQTT